MATKFMYVMEQVWLGGDAFEAEQAIKRMMFWQSSRACDRAGDELKVKIIHCRARCALYVVEMLSAVLVEIHCWL